MKQFEFVRFCYRGPLNVEDYLCEGTIIRDWDVIRASMASREYKKLEPQQLQEILVGAGTSGIDLGMLPIRQRKQYEQFRTLFKKLLNLAHLKQDELKDAFLQIHGAGLQQRNVDLSGNYGEPYSQFLRKKRDIDDLKKSQPMIESALESVKNRGVARSKAATLWKIIQGQYIRHKEENQHKISKLRTQMLGNKTELAFLSDKRGDQAKSKEEQKESLLRWQIKLEALAQREKELGRFEPDFERAKMANLQTEIEKLTGQIIDSKKSPNELRNRQKRLQQEVSTLSDLIENSEDMIANILCNHMDEDSLELIFKIINPAIVHLKRGESIAIEDLELALLPLKAILSKIEGAEFSDQGVRIDLSRLQGPGLKALKDPKLLEQQLAEIKNELTEINNALDAAKNREKLVALRDGFEKQKNEILINLDNWARYQVELKKESDWLNQKEDCRKAIVRATDELDKIDKAIKLEDANLQNCESEIKAATKSITDLEESLRKALKPDEKWDYSDAVKGSDDIYINISEYNELFREAMNFEQQVCEARKTIERMTYDRFSSVDESTWIKAMKDDIDGLNKKEEAVNHMWYGIIAGMRKDFKALKRDLEMMRSYVTSFNKSIAKSNVSNLTSLKIMINHRGSLTAPIEKLINEQEVPLLAGKETVIDSLGELLQKQPKISLDDLFDLSFIVESEGAQAKTYKQLDSIESNGTTITIKALIYLLLIKKLMTKNVRLPFYLDEAASLSLAEKYFFIM